jgi:hypothetical protein
MVFNDAVPRWTHVQHDDIVADVRPKVALNSKELIVMTLPSQHVKVSGCSRLSIGALVLNPPPPPTHSDTPPPPPRSQALIYK